MPSINCPGAANPGTDITITGTVASCDPVEHVVARDGAPVSHSYDCDRGDFTIKLTVPACNTGSNVLIVSVKDSTGTTASCSIPINCP